MQELPDKEFNLLEEPWILARLKNGETREFSLLEIFRRAPEIQELAGELPTQDVAVLRLLLAVMYGAFVTEEMDTEDALALWKELYELGAFPMDILEEYLGKYRDRFWLFHPEHPFYQSADFLNVLNTYRKEHGKREGKEDGSRKKSSLPRMIGDLSQSANKVRLFPGRTGKAQEVLSYGEAARWLLHLNGFDDNSGKNPTPKGQGYLGQLGLVYARGRSLFETLLLNFVLLDDRNEVVGDINPAAKAYWEKETFPAVMHLIPQPRALKELYTLQSRRILLKRNAQHQVYDYESTAGDYFDGDQGLLAEPMTLWALDTKKHVFIPKKHNPARQIWRDFSSIICTSRQKGSQKDSGVVHWLELLRENELLPNNVVNLRTVGIRYDFKGTTWMISDIVDDSLILSKNLLSRLQEGWVNEIASVLQKTDEAVTLACRLAAAVVGVSQGADNEENRRKAASQKERMQCYSLLDKDFRSWLGKIEPSANDCETKMEKWKQTAKRIILEEGSRLMDSCSETLLTGYVKPNPEKGRDDVFNLFTAYEKFSSGVYAALQ